MNTKLLYQKMRKKFSKSDKVGGRAGKSAFHLTTGLPHGIMNSVLKTKSGDLKKKRDVAMKKTLVMAVAVFSLLVKSASPAPPTENVVLPPDFQPDPGLYEKFWEQKGIFGPVACSPDGRTMAVVCGNVIKILDWNTDNILKTLEGQTEDIWSVSYSPDGTQLAAGTSSGLTVWRVK